MRSGIIDEIICFGGEINHFQGEKKCVGGDIRHFGDELSVLKVISSILRVQQSI